MDGISMSDGAHVLGVDACKKGWVGLTQDLRGYFGRTIRDLAAALGREVVDFPSDHGSFFDGAHGETVGADAVGARLRVVLGTVSDPRHIRLSG